MSTARTILAFTLLLNACAGGSLFTAMSAHDATAAKKMLADGADPNAPDAEGDTPLCFAILQNDLEMARTLAAARADLDKTCTTKEWLESTPLELASYLQRKEMVSFLIEGGANPEHKTGVIPFLVFVAMMPKAIDTPHIGRLYLDWVEKKRGKEAMLATANNGGPDDTTPLAAAVERGDYELVGELLERGVDPNTLSPAYRNVDEKGEKWPPLFFAKWAKKKAQLSHPGEVVLDPPRGADIDKAVAMLLAAKANPNAKSGDGLSYEEAEKEAIAQNERLWAKAVATYEAEKAAEQERRAEERRERRAERRREEAEQQAQWQALQEGLAGLGTASGTSGASGGTSETSVGGGGGASSGGITVSETPSSSTAPSAPAPSSTSTWSAMTAKPPTPAKERNCTERVIEGDLNSHNEHPTREAAEHEIDQMGHGMCMGIGGPNFSGRSCQEGKRNTVKIVNNVIARGEEVPAWGCSAHYTCAQPRKSCGGASTPENSGAVKQ